VWPTNRDRSAFQEVMGAAPPVNYESLMQRGSKLVLVLLFSCAIDRKSSQRSTIGSGKPGKLSVP
jgi:hypothetical protein